jgi:hypothetical protein
MPEDRIASCLTPAGGAKDIVAAFEKTVEPCPICRRTARSDRVK